MSAIARLGLPKGKTLLYASKGELLLIALDAPRPMAYGPHLIGTRSIFQATSCAVLVRHAGRSEGASTQSRDVV